jgi:hypothetical protein
MSDSDTELLKQILEAIRGDSSGGSIGGSSRTDDTTAADRLNKRFDDIAKSVQRGDRHFKDLGSSLHGLDDAINTVSDTSHRAALQSRRDELATKIRNDIIAESAKNSAKAVSDTLGKAVPEVAGGFVKNLQGSSSGTKIASDLMVGAIDVAQGALSGIGSATAATGAAMTGMPGKFRAVGFGLTALGSSLSFLTESASKLAKFGISVMSAEVEKTANAYSNLSSAGAMFASGMEGMRNAAYESGLDLVSFSEVIKTNQGVLASSGLTVSDAVKEVGAVTARFSVQTGKSGKTLQEEMLKLGYSIKEQADVAIQYAADVKRSGMDLRRPESATAAADYAKNLRLIADITGQDAKSKMDQARKATEKTAFFNMVRKQAQETGDESLLPRIQQALTFMPEHIQRSIVQAGVANGTITDVATNQYGQGDVVRSILAKMMSGGTSVEDMVLPYQQWNDAFKKEGSELTNQISMVNTLLPGVHAELAAAADDMMQNSIKFNSETMAKGIESVNKSMTVGNKATDEFIRAQQEAQKLRIDAEKELSKLLPDFAKITAEVLASIRKSLDEFKRDASGESKSGIFTNSGIGSEAALLLGGYAATKLLPYGARAGATAATGLGRAGAVGAKMIGKGGIGAVGALGLDYAADKLNESGQHQAGAWADTGSYAIGAAGAGAMLGSIVPIIGTTVGAALGAAGGGAYGLYKNWEKLWGENQELVNKKMSDVQASVPVASDIKKGAESFATDVSKDFTNLSKLLMELRDMTSDIRGYLHDIKQQTAE